MGFLSILTNQQTSFVFFHWLSFDWGLMATSGLSNITLVISLISFLAGLINIMLGLFCSVWNSPHQWANAEEFYGVICSAANKFYSLASHHEQKNTKTTGQIKFLVVTIKQQIKLVWRHSLFFILYIYDLSYIQLIKSLIS